MFTALGTTPLARFDLLSRTKSLHFLSLPGPLPTYLSYRLLSYYKL